MRKFLSNNLIKNMKDYTKRVCALLEKHRNEKAAASMSNTTKNKCKFLGIRIVELKELYKTIFLNFPLPSYEECKNIIRELYSIGEREYMYFGTQLFLKRRKSWTKTDIVFIESLILAQPGWDTTEDITNELVSVYAKKYQSTALEFITSWSSSKNQWLKAAAIMFQRQYKDDTDRRLLEKFITENMKTDNEIINRAIGAALRDYSKVDHEWVLKFVINNSSDLDKKSKQEAIKWMDKKGLIS